MTQTEKQSKKIRLQTNLFLFGKNPRVAIISQLPRLHYCLKGTPYQPSSSSTTRTPQHCPFSATTHTHSIPITSSGSCVIDAPVTSVHVLFSIESTSQKQER